jgi:hypothetical protein
MDGIRQGCISEWNYVPNLTTRRQMAIRQLHLILAPAFLGNLRS